ncbi:hypothetical protein [Pseudomonas frederiksbergensis]|uniref:hypothetical protein n=1 Tax=Pseudomonas frederiksbergensis TaxID=104087 RepID=UPI001FE7EF4E|nr:hypothetical protein [Pseudomonas frederiksbergensis]
MSILMGSIVGNLTAKQPDAQVIVSDFKTCRIGLNCSEISNLTIKNIPTKEKPNITITQSENIFTLHASNSSSIIEFTTKSPLLCGPSVYMNDKKPVLT